MQRIYRSRVKLVAELLAEPQVCPVDGCSNLADSPHEPAFRSRGGSILDPDNVVAVCWEHNQSPPPEFVTSKAEMRHPFIGDAIGFKCAICRQPMGGWRHR